MYPRVLGMLVCSTCPAALTVGAPSEHSRSWILQNKPRVSKELPGSLGSHQAQDDTPVPAMCLGLHNRDTATVVE